VEKKRIYLIIFCIIIGVASFSFGRFVRFNRSDRTIFTEHKRTIEQLESRFSDISSRNEELEIELESARSRAFKLEGNIYRALEIAQSTRDLHSELKREMESTGDIFEDLERQQRAIRSYVAELQGRIECLESELGKR